MYLKAGSQQPADQRAASAAKAPSTTTVGCTHIQRQEPPFIITVTPPPEPATADSAISGYVIIATLRLLSIVEVAVCGMHRLFGQRTKAVDLHPAPFKHLRKQCVQ